jgi:hypothetical protein
MRMSPCRPRLARLISLTRRLHQNISHVTRSHSCHHASTLGANVLTYSSKTSYLGTIISPTPANSLRASKTSLEDSFHLAWCCGSIFTFYAAHDLNMST